MSTTTVAILAGGASRRMGSDKSFTPLGSKTVFEHVLTQVQALQLPILLITNTPEKYSAYALPMVQDILPDKGSLGGLYTAIQVAESDFTLCVACDMPFLNVKLLCYLLDLCTPVWDVVVPRIDGRCETMHAVYNKTCLEIIRKQLTRRELKASAFFKQVRVNYVDEDVLRQFDPDLRSFMNVNTPDDLELARHLMLE